MNSHKLTVQKNDEATVIAEKIIDADAKEIVLAVPRFSKLGEAAQNFRLLKREAEALGKRLVIESVDDAVVEQCKAVGLECMNPFFEKPQRQFSDIVTAGEKGRRDRARHPDRGKLPHQEARVAHESAAARPAGGDGRRRKRGKKFIFASVTGLLLIGAGVFLAVGILPRAEIKITTVKADWSYSNSIIADTAVSIPEAESAKIPGQTFSERKNVTLRFPASGKGRLDEKAKGIITVYNAHSAAPQTLVATTRFEAPDGKIFRLQKNVIVPGAKVSEGKLEAVSIDAEVAADKPGDAYNIGPVEKFTIPGFAGGPRFVAFYGSSKEPMSGGFSGDSLYATEQDIAEAKKTIAATLEQSMRGLVQAQLPKEFTFIEGAAQFAVTNVSVNPVADEHGQFSVFAEAEITAMAFREQDLIRFFSDRIAREIGGDKAVVRYTLEYGEPRLKENEASFFANYRAVLAPNINIDSFKEKIAGQAEDDLRAIIFSLRGVESARISLWPFWVRRVPEDTGKIKVTID